MRAEPELAREALRSFNTPSCPQEVTQSAEVTSSNPSPPSYVDMSKKKT
jgi:hypothetical protein